MTMEAFSYSARSRHHGGIMNDRTITINECVFGGRFIVCVEPRVIDRPSQEFRDLGQARDCAAKLSAETRWPVLDKTGGDHG